MTSGGIRPQTVLIAIAAALVLLVGALTLAPRAQPSSTAVATASSTPTPSGSAAEPSVSAAESASPSTSETPSQTAGSSAPPATAISAASSTSASGSGATLLAAGDIAECGNTESEATAQVLAGLPGTIATLGDNAYENGTAAEYANCFGPSWGRLRDRIRPAAGNHEYQTPGATPYYDYFGAAAGSRGLGYYSYDLGGWHIVVLNSNCAAIGGCGASSSENVWLRTNLAASKASCTLAIWHHPRWSSGITHGSDASYDAFWRSLYQFGAEIVLNGHEHMYERFAPQNPDGQRDDARGIREFVVGTGGKSLYPVRPAIANSQLINNNTYGVIQLILRPGGYDWRFVPVAGSTFADSGSGVCH